MKALIIIPARYASTRFPGKPLVHLTGAGGDRKSLIQRTWEAARSVRDIDRVVVATDDERIRDAAEAFGAEVVMTSSSCRNGTERCADAVRILQSPHDIVVNLQGDAPLTPRWFVEDLVRGMENAPDADVATPVLRCDGRSVNGFLEDRANGRVGGTTAVFGRDNFALYFSKEVIPYTGRVFKETEETPVFHHVGVYAYRPSALNDYLEWPSGPLEDLEGLEQLRFLENRRSVLCVEVEARGREFWELNNPEDVPRIEAMMKRMNLD